MAQPFRNEKISFDASQQISNINESSYRHSRESGNLEVGRFSGPMRVFRTRPSAAGCRCHSGSGFQPLGAHNGGFPPSSFRPTVARAGIQPALPATTPFPAETLWIPARVFTGVIPAKAGIQFLRQTLDSRFRGNDAKERSEKSELEAPFGGATHLAGTLLQFTVLLKNLGGNH